MNTRAVLPVFYFPPIGWFKHFLNDSTRVSLEQMENFPKQTFRNRTHIYGANGKLPLFIPIRHDGQRLYRDVQISYAENWQALHWKSIKTAYQGSAYFEYYEDALEPIFQDQESSLLKHNLKALNLVLDLLKTPKEFELTTAYEKEFLGDDLRSAFSAKQPSQYAQKPYYQTFSDKYGYLNDLSVLDLLCNLGPESALYIRTSNENLK